MKRKELINKKLKNIIYLTSIILVMLLVLAVSFFVENTVLMIMLYLVFSGCLIFMVPFMFKIHEYSQELKLLKEE